MSDAFDSTTRWEALREAIVGAGGLVETLHTQLDFGLLIYDAPADVVICTITGGACPDCPSIHANVPPAPNALDAVRGAFFDTPPGGLTPTVEALDVAVASLPVATACRPAVVLFTDGAPNNFCNPSSMDPSGDLIASAADYTANGIAIHVVGLAGMDAQLIAHLEQLATSAGTGPALLPTDVASLNQAMSVLGQDLLACRP